jgi:3-methyladenine DNA glycosylase AlkD
MFIGRAINLRPRLSKFCDSHNPSNGPGVQQWRLQPWHWVALDKLHTSLEIFYHTTMLAQGAYSSAGYYVLMLSYMLERLHDTASEYHDLWANKKKKDFKPMEEAAHAAHTKITKYWDKMDETPAYYAALIMQPAIRLLWFTDNWQESGDGEKQKWYMTTTTAVKELWLDEYKGKFELPTADHSTAATPKERDPDAESTIFYDHIKVNYRTRVDAYDEYVAAIPQEGSDALAYAKEIEASRPDLARFMYDMAAIPAMSAECERVFSSAKILLSDRRARMTATLIEAYECLRHWLLDDALLKHTPPQKDAETAQQEMQDAEDNEAAYNEAAAPYKQREAVDSEFTGSYSLDDD